MAIPSPCKVYLGERGCVATDSDYYIWIFGFIAVTEWRLQPSLWDCCRRKIKSEKSSIEGV